MAIVIKNLGRLNRKLNALSKPGGLDVYIEYEMARGADDIVAMAKRFAPVDTGKLRDSIGWTWGFIIPEGATALGTIGSRRKKSKSTNKFIITVYAGSKEVFYAKWREFGTVVQKAHPYFFPAYRANRKAFKSRVRKAVRKAIREAAKG